MDLAQRYAALLTERGYQSDPAQVRAVQVLGRVGGDLAARRSAAGKLARLRRRLSREPVPPVRGAYLWGGVGRGKTFVMDMFCDSLPPGVGLRYHFHRLMYRVHGRLRSLGQRRDPLEEVAAEFAGQARVICFDEFFVKDIADAMILGNLLDALFRREVTLVATSNIPPEELYQGGLQRQRFLPAIDLITTHTEVLRVDGGTDYRLRLLERAGLYHWPLDSGAEAHLERWFRDIAPDEGRAGQPIEINGRDILTRRRADGVAWFDFAALCDGPRSQEDYIEIARAFQAVIVSGLPVLDETMENPARRFIALVDEFYDRRVKLIVSAAAPAEQLYRGSRLNLEFQRTASRLLEMQSGAYLAAPHVP